MRPAKPGEIRAMVAAPAARRYEYFVKRVVDSGEVFGVWRDGWAMVADDSNNLALPLWSASEFAAFFAVDDWAGYEVRAISLNEFFRELVSGALGSRVSFAVFPVGSISGVVRHPSELVSDLRSEMAKYP